MLTSSSPISLRKPTLDLSAAIPRYYLRGNPFETHFFNALNLLFPDGERFFVKSVHDHAGSVKDPDLKAEVRAFAGQEGQHAHQHERFFGVLAAQGYRTQGLLRVFRWLLRVGRMLPRGLRLSITVGGEHLTAIMAMLTLRHEILQGADPTMRALIEWHSLEEIEHKHVAHDVFSSAYGSGYLLRMLGYFIIVPLIIGFAAIGSRILIAQDLNAGRLSRAELREAKRASRAGLAAYRRDQSRALLRYLKPSFHPNQQDDSQLLRDLAPRIEQAIHARRVSGVADA